MTYFFHKIKWTVPEPQHLPSLHLLGKGRKEERWSVVCYLAEVDEEGAGGAVHTVAAVA